MSSVRDRCKLCGHCRGMHEDAGDGIVECPNRAGFVTPDQFEPDSDVARRMRPAAREEAGEPDTVIEGVGKDAPVTVNAAGGKQSHCPYRVDLFPPRAALAVSAVLKHGADKYGENNWHLITVGENLNHALTHIFAFLAGDGSDDHLEHAACRVLFALDQKLAGRPKGGAA